MLFFAFFEENSLHLKTAFRWLNDSGVAVIAISVTYIICIRAERMLFAKPYDLLVLAPTYSCVLYWRLPLALTGLTAECGMGSGVTPSLKAPGQKDHWHIMKKSSNRLSLLRW